VSHEQRAPSLDVIAWLAAVPTAGLFLAAILWLAPPLADVILPTPHLHFFIRGASRPEPVELLRFGLAIAAPAALAALLIAGARYVRPIAQLPGTAVVLLLQVGVAVFLAFCWFAQRDALPWGLPLTTYFTLRDVLVAVVVAVGLGLLSARGAGLLRRADAFARSSRWRLLAPVAIALLITALWLLPAIFRARTIGDNVAVLLHLETDLDEFLAVANGHTPMVDFAAQYTNLLPYPVNWILSIVGYYTVGKFTAAMWALSVAALMSAYAALARVTASRLAALGLYVPFVAISLYPVCRGTDACSIYLKPDERLFMANLYQVFPIRYLGPFVLAWLLARHLLGQAPRRPLVLFGLAALTAVNNTDFGLACFAATLVGLWLGSDERAMWRRGLWLAGQAALALLVVCVLVSAFTLLRAGALPDPEVLFYFPRLFGRAGFGLLPMPTLGFHIVIYATLAGALVYAAVRKASGDRGAVLTGALAYGAVFGLGAGIYYAGRSTPSTLVAMFSAWGFVVALLTWAVVTSPRLWRPVGKTALARSLLPATFVLFSFGLMASTITRFPMPWSEVRRIADSGVAPLDRSAAVAFVSRRTVPGERVAILEAVGHGIARDSNVVDVSPFNTPGNIVTTEQMDYVRRSLDEAGGRKVFTATNVYKPINEYLRRKAYMPVATDAASRLVEWQAPPRARGTSTGPRSAAP
jgi:hypothetical protein